MIFRPEGGADDAGIQRVDHAGVQSPGELVGEQRVGELGLVVGPRRSRTSPFGGTWQLGVVSRLPKASTVEQARHEKMIFTRYVLSADMVETWRLWATVDAWWPAIEVLITTRVTNARTEAANTGIKQIKRTGRGYRNPAHYQARILLRSAARRAA
jgi:Transposase